jgi:hypothetical protein
MTTFDEHFEKLVCQQFCVSTFGVYASKEQIKDSIFVKRSTAMLHIWQPIFWPIRVTF